MHAVLGRVRTLVGAPTLLLGPPQPAPSSRRWPAFTPLTPVTAAGPDALPQDLARRIERALDLVSLFVARCEQIDPEVAMTPFSSDRASESQDRARHSHSHSHSVPSSSPVGSLVSTPRHDGGQSSGGGAPVGLARAVSDSIVEYGDG
jgi:hypothetical protein